MCPPFPFRRFQDTNQVSWANAAWVVPLIVAIGVASARSESGRQFPNSGSERELPSSSSNFSPHKKGTLIPRGCVALIVAGLAAICCPTYATVGGTNGRATRKNKQAADLVCRVLLGALSSGGDTARPKSAQRRSGGFVLRLNTRFDLGPPVFVGLINNTPAWWGFGAPLRKTQWP